MDWSSFKEKLDQHYTWPAPYIFKFIVPKERKDELKQLFPEHLAIERISKNGNHVSITYQIEVKSSEVIITLYQNAAQIEGVISL